MNPHYSDDTFKNLENLVEVCQWLGQQGWVPATSGNFSIKDADQQIWVTASGVHKARLKVEDFLLVDSNGMPINTNRRPSDETLLHTALYRYNPDLTCVLHTHSYFATLVSLIKKTSITLSNYELLKVFPNETTHETSITMPIFANTQNMEQLANDLLDYLTSHPATSAFLISGHGVYTWGQSIREAQRHIEALEFLFRLEIELEKHTHA